MKAPEDQRTRSGQLMRTPAPLVTAEVVRLQNELNTAHGRPWASPPNIHREAARRFFADYCRRVNRKALLSRLLGR